MTTRRLYWHTFDLTKREGTEQTVRQNEDMSAESEGLLFCIMVLSA